MKTPKELLELDESDIKIIEKSFKDYSYCNSKGFLITTFSSELLYFVISKKTEKVKEYFSNFGWTLSITKQEKSLILSIKPIPNWEDPFEELEEKK